MNIYNSDLKIFVLTIPREIHRIHALFGHLQTMKFPIYNEDIIEVYNGFDYTEYDRNPTKLINALIADGFTNWLNAEDERIWNTPDFYMGQVIHWAMLKMLRIIANGNRDTLVIENDAFFRRLTYKKLVKRWETLKNLAGGHENVNVAMLFYYPRAFDKADLRALGEHERLDNFWMKGCREAGQVANIYTPHGARWILDNKPWQTTIENWLGELSKQEPQHGLYSSINVEVECHLYANYNTPHTINHYKNIIDSAVWERRMRGIDL